MKLPESLSQELAGLVVNQIPWAIRRLRHLADLQTMERGAAWQATWSAATPARKSALITYLAGVLEAPTQNYFVLQHRPVPPEFSGWYEKVKDQLVALLGAPLLPIEVSTAIESVAAKSTSLSLDPQGAMPALWEDQVAHIREVMQTFAGKNDNGEFGEILCSSYISLGMSCLKAGNREKAVRAFDQGISIANAHENLPQVINGAYHLAALYSQGVQDINQALKRVLPLWEQYHNGAPSLDLAQLADTLATAYARVGDPFETSHFNEATAELLTASGFPLPDNLGLTTVLTNWVAAAKSRVEINQNHYSDFQRVLALWLNNLRLRMQFTADGAEWKTLKERGELLQDIYYQITELFNLQQRKDNELMREIQGAYDYDPIDAVRMVLPGELIDSIEKRLAGRAFSEQLLLDIKALSEHPAIKQDKKLRMANHWRMGACLHGLGQTPLAARHLRQAHHLAEEIGDLDDVLFALYQRASVMLPTEARSILSFCLEGITKTEEARNNVITPYQQSAFFNGRTELYRMAIAWACELGEWDTVLGVGELLKARNFLLHVDDADAIATLRTNLARHYDGLMDSFGAKRIELLRQRQLSYDNWLLENIRQAKQWEQVLPGKDLQESLRQGEVALSYYEINAGAWLVALISCEQLIVEMITVAPEVMAGWMRQISALGNPDGAYRARGMGTYQGNAKPVEIKKKGASTKATLMEISSYLLPPHILEGLEGADRLFICPQGVLHRVPFHALPVNNTYLIEKLAISYLPNLRSLQYKDNEYSSGRGIVLVGTESFKSDGRGHLADLKGAREEVEQLGDYYEAQGVPVTSYLEGRANREAILEAGTSGVLGQKDIIHIALHGEDVPTDNPLDARLFVNDGSIDGFDISHWELSAELVVLSACFAGVRAIAGRGLESLPGDDIFGLQAAFFSAGARRVFGALWPVADQVGKDLMVDFHNRLVNLPPARAWRETVIAHLAQASASEQSPQYWAPFFLVEEGRE